MYKKFFCIALFIVILTGMTCVVASEDIGTNNDTIANAEDLEVQTTPVNDELNTNYNEDAVLEASSTNTGKLNPNMKSEVKTTNEYVNIITTVNKNATGNVSIEITKLNNKTYKLNDNVKVKNGIASWGEFISFEKGDYIAKMTYSGDKNYFSKSISKVFEIPKTTTELKVYITTNDEFVRIATVTNEDATGTVTIKIKTAEEENYTEYATMDLENGIAIWADQIPFKRGTYVAYTTYNGDDKYFSTSNIQTFKIKKDRTELNATVITEDSFVQLNVTTNPNATGNIIIYIKNATEENFTKYATEELENGTAFWGEFIVFRKGNYDVYVEYPGDDYFFEAATTQTFSIEKELPEINVKITTDEAFVTIVANVTEDATGNVTFFIKTFEEENYTEYATIDVENGTAVWSCPEAFDKGDYVAFTVYNGDEKYFKIANTQTFKIKKQIHDFDVNITVDEYLIILNATLPENATGNVTVRIKASDDENYTEYATTDVKNGTAVWAEFMPFNKGEYTAFTTYNGDENYFKAENTQTFTIEKQVPLMLINSTVDGTNVTVTVTLPENATGTVTLSNNKTGIFRNITLNGTSVTFTEQLIYGYNVFDIEYTGDNYYFGLENTVVESLKAKTGLNVKSSVTVTYLNTGKITVKLNILSEDGNLSADGESISLIINNKKFSATLKNGTATISIAANNQNKFIPGTYNGKVVFEGNDYLKNVSSGLKLVVNKGTPKLTAKAKTFKVNTKTKKYAITLKNAKNGLLKNQKVTLKVNGKTFKATTNSKGQATFKITNLKKKAKFIALIKYNGNKYYKSISKKVTFTVKK